MKDLLFNDTLQGVIEALPNDLKWFFESAIVHDRYTEEIAAAGYEAYKGREVLECCFSGVVHFSLYNKLFAFYKAVYNGNIDNVTIINTTDGAKTSSILYKIDRCIFPFLVTTPSAKGVPNKVTISFACLAKQ